MQVWRLAAHPYAKLLDGGGNRATGGRWNSPGRGVVYVASHLSLAVLEKLVHLDPDLLPDNLAQVRMTFPADAGIERITVDQLPDGWRDDPNERATRQLGDKWLEVARTLALEVPSVIVPEETNLVFNPGHPSIADVTIQEIKPFEFDPRLIPLSED